MGFIDPIMGPFSSHFGITIKASVPLIDHRIGLAGVLFWPLDFNLILAILYSRIANKNG